MNVEKLFKNKCSKRKSQGSLANLKTVATSDVLITTPDIEYIVDGEPETQSKRLEIGVGDFFIKVESDDKNIVISGVPDNRITDFFDNPEIIDLSNLKIERTDYEYRKEEHSAIEELDETGYALNSTAEKVSPPMETELNMDVDASIVTEVNSSIKVEPEDIGEMIDPPEKIYEQEDLKCEICDIKFKREDIFDKHLNLHKTESDERLLKCVLCQYQSSVKYDLINHMQMHVNPPKRQRLTCSICEYIVYDNAAMEKHIRGHNKVKDPPISHQCILCSYNTGSKWKFDNHVLCHESKGRFKCNECDYETHNKKNLTRHMKKHQYSSYGTNISRSSLGKFKCFMCKFSSNRKAIVMTHMEDDHTQDVEDKTKVECKLCDYSTCSERSLSKHITNAHLQVIIPLTRITYPLKSSKRTKTTPRRS